ncbi:MAG TPA: N-acetyltransferase [Hyphomicrobiales bacterium]|nr:N-acetyltransferase [Hyphomicrobiales bacterium]
MNALTLEILPETSQDAAAIEKLHERAFGPGRFVKSAYRLREGVPPVAELSFIARVGTFLVGSIRLTPIRVGTAEALLLGPLTVEPAFANRGIGLALMQKALAAAEARGDRLVFLVGDEPYYARAGFRTVAPAGRIRLPGPADPRRVLVRELAAGAFDGVSGDLMAAR